MTTDYNLEPNGASRYQSLSVVGVTQVESGIYSHFQAPGQFSLDFFKNKNK